MELHKLASAKKTCVL